MLNSQPYFLLSLIGGLQEVSEDPLGHVPALLPPLFIREAEMDALVDADIDRIPGHIREAVIRARVRDQPVGAALTTVKVMSSVPKKSASVRVSAPATLLKPEV